MNRPRLPPARAALLAVLGTALALGAAMAPARAATPPAGGEARATPARPAASAPPGKAIVQWDHIIDSNDRTFEDFWGFQPYKQTHHQAW